MLIRLPALPARSPRGEALYQHPGKGRVFGDPRGWLAVKRRERRLLRRCA